MYNLLENRNKSFADFKKFMDYMVKERAYINGLTEKDLDDFLYHYNKLRFYPCFNGIRVLTKPLN